MPGLNSILPIKILRSLWLSETKVQDLKNSATLSLTQFFLNWVDERIERIRKNVKDAAELREVLEPHENARLFWQNRVQMANADTGEDAHSVIEESSARAGRLRPSAGAIRILQIGSDAGGGDPKAAGPDAGEVSGGWKSNSPATLMDRGACCSITGCARAQDPSSRLYQRSPFVQSQ